MALNRSPTLLIDHRCSHPAGQFFTYNPIAHHREGSRRSAVTRGASRLTHEGTALIFVAVASTEEGWSMVVIQFLYPAPDPFLTLLNPISQCCWETTPGRTRCDWMGHQRPSWAPKHHPGYISLRLVSGADVPSFPGCSSNLQGGHFLLLQVVFAWHQQFHQATNSQVVK